MQNTPKGKLIAVGGNENKGACCIPGTPESLHEEFLENGILKRILREMHDSDDRLEIITTASEIPEEVGENYLQAFYKLGYTNIGLLSIQERKEAFYPENLERISRAGAVLFSGGDQLRLTSVFGGTEFLEILHDRYQDEPFVIAGTSAGAMAMSKVMIARGEPEYYLLKGGVRIERGLAFINNLIIDTHFVNRGRFGRLVEAVAANPDCLGVGIGEDTGIVIRDGNSLEVIGTGTVILASGKYIGHSNVNQTDTDQPLSVENLKVHILNRGNGYFVNEEQFVLCMSTLAVK